MWFNLIQISLLIKTLNILVLCAFFCEKNWPGSAKRTLFSFVTPQQFTPATLINIEPFNSKLNAEVVEGN